MSSGSNDGRSTAAMPPGLVLRYERPAPDIAECITGYHVYGSDRLGQVDRFLPGTANVRVTLDAGPVRIDIADRSFDPIPVASVFGPTSHAIRAVTNGGLMVGFGISAIGWARLTRRSAAEVHDRVVAAAAVLDPAATDAIVAALQREGAGALARVLDPRLRAMLGPPHPAEPAIRALAALIAQDGATDVMAAAARLGLAAKSLRRVATRYFGLTPKLLLTRARFLRSFLRNFPHGETGDGAGSYAGIDPSYHDVSHFLRDAQQYLGMTPRRFIAESTPLLRASLRTRAAVLGTSTQALHDPTRASPSGA